MGNKSIRAEIAFVTGYRPGQLAARNWWRKRIIEVTLAGDGEMPAPKRFKAKHELPELNNYRGSAPSSFWDTFPKNYA